MIAEDLRLMVIDILEDNPDEDSLWLASKIVKSIIQEMKDRGFIDDDCESEEC